MVVNRVSLSGTGQYANVLLDSRCGAPGAGHWINIRADGGNARKILVGGRSQSADSFQELTFTGALTTGDSPHVITAIWNYATDTIKVRIDGSENSTSVSFGASTYTHASPATTPKLMQHATEAAADKRDIRAFFLFNYELSGADLTNMESYLLDNFGDANSADTTGEYDLLLSGGRFDALISLGGGVILVGSRNPTPGRIFRSVDYGENWSDLGNVTGTSGDDGITSFSSYGGTTVYLSTENGKAWKSTDGGQNWNDLGTVSTGGSPEGGFARCYQIIELSSGTVLLSDTQNIGGHIWRSTNGGSSWTDIGAVGSRGLYRIMATTDGVILNTWGGHVYKSEDDGQTWIDKATLVADELYAIDTSGSKAFQGSDGGRTFISNDDGDNWIETWQPSSDNCDDATYIGNGRLFLSMYAGNKLGYMSVTNGLTWDSGRTIGSEVGDSFEKHIFLEDNAGPLLIAVTNKGYIYRTRTPNGFELVPTETFCKYLLMASM